MADLEDINGVGPSRKDSLEDEGYDSVESVAQSDPETLADDVGVSEDTALDWVVQAENISGVENAEVEESEPEVKRSDEQQQQQTQADTDSEEQEDRDVDASAEQADDNEDMDATTGENPDYVDEDAHRNDVEDNEEGNNDAAQGNTNERQNANVNADENVERRDVDEGAEQRDDTGNDNIDATTGDSPDYDSDVEQDDHPVQFTLSFDGPEQYDAFYSAMLRHRETMLMSNRNNTEVFDRVLEQLRNQSPDGDLQVEVRPNELNDIHNAVRKLTVEYQSNNLIDQMNAMKDVQNDVNEVREEHLF